MIRHGFLKIRGSLGAWSVQDSLRIHGSSIQETADY